MDINIFVSGTITGGVGAAGIWYFLRRALRIRRPEGLLPENGSKKSQSSWFEDLRDRVSTLENHKDAHAREMRGLKERLSGAETYAERIAMIEEQIGILNHDVTNLRAERQRHRPPT